MKKSIYVRLMTAMAGFVLLCAAAGIVAEGFFGVPVLTALTGLLTSGSALAVLAKLLLTAVMAVLAVASLICALPPKKRKQNDFVMQKGENGAIGISVKAIEKQVRACVAKHDVIADAEVSIREGRDGLIILLDVDQVAGVNIPLSVGLLQKQVRQYVSGCTGVDVQEVRVMVENNTTNVVASPFAVQDAVIPSVRPAAEEPRVQPTTEPVAEPAAEAAAESATAEAAVPAVPAPVMIPEIPAMPPETEATQVEDDRPLHQRIFGAEEQPVFVPAPPDLVVEAQENDVDEPEAEQPDAAEEEELVIEAVLDEIPPQEAAEAGNAFTEAILAEEADEADETAETNEAEAAEADEEEEPQGFTI